MFYLRSLRRGREDSNLEKNAEITQREVPPILFPARKLL